MQLTNEQVKHIADLACLELSEEEIDVYKGQLSSVLGYINQLSEVDTVNINVNLDSLVSEEVLRGDVVNEWDKKEQNNALSQAQELEGQQIKVGKIL